LELPKPNLLRVNETASKIYADESYLTFSVEKATIFVTVENCAAWKSENFKTPLFLLAYRGKHFEHQWHCVCSRKKCVKN
jgi:hypothetical protein